MQTATSMDFETHLNAGSRGPGGVALAGPDPEVEAARAQEYALISALTARPPSQALLDRLARLRGDGTPLGAAHAALARAASRTRASEAETAFFALFVGVGRGEFLPYGSYYLTGFLNERPLAAVRQDLDRLGLARAEGLHDPEDHIAILTEVMAALARGDGAAVPDARTFFVRHIEPWAGRFFEDLAAARTLDFYRALGALGAAFVAVESTGFALDGPRPQATMPGADR